MYCKICGSTEWCGRPCVNEPKAKTRGLEKQRNRQARWRQKNRPAYNEKMRRLMQERRDRGLV